MPSNKLKAFLDSQGVKYISVSHSPAYTAQEIAASAHIPGKELAKTVIVKLDGRLAMVVLPASAQVSFSSLKAAAGVGDVDLADEDEFKDRFPDCELGAMPPFGNLYGMQVYVAKTLTYDKEIAFNAGSHAELVKLAYADYQRLVEPIVIEL
jgi:Ala-tRNA(Pro) deacylase